MTRTLLFIGYHVLLCLAILALQGCSSFKTPKGALPWQRKQAEELGADGQPIDVPAAIAKGVNHERTGQYDKARDVYEKLLADSPNNSAGTSPQMIAVGGRSGRIPTTLACQAIDQATPKASTPPMQPPAKNVLNALSAAGVQVETAARLPTTTASAVGTIAPRPMLTSDEPSSCPALMVCSQVGAGKYSGYQAQLGRG
jgi:hypothetical protein